MKHYKKRTIALCLASVLTVVGAFGAENYNNSLMGIKINNGSNGFVSVTAYTKQAFIEQTPLKRLDEDTYVLELPETNSETKTPSIDGYNNIESIEIVTLPYTDVQKGSTKVVIKTKGSPVVKTNVTLFIDDKASKVPVKPKETSYWDTQRNASKTSSSEENKVEKTQINRSQQKYVTKETKIVKEEPAETAIPDYSSESNSVPATVFSMTLIFVLILILVVGVIYVTGRDKMATIVGDQGKFDLGDEEEGKKKSDKTGGRKKSNKKKTAAKKKSKKDNKYSEPSVNIVTGTYEQPTESTPPAEKEEATIVVDLDTLYNEKNKQEQSEKEQNKQEQIVQEQNAVQEEQSEDDLADFLNEFSFDSEVAEEEEPFDEQLYEEVINSKNIKFSVDDIEKINNLIQIEISEEILNKISEYRQQLKDEPKLKTPNKIMENILTSYAINQNLSFTKEDINAIEKIMNVELDSDFVTNLHTNPARVKVVENELKKQTTKPHRTSEILTLNVRDLLPDLSKELKKQGKKKIESNKKPETVYFSEGYEVSKFTVSKDLEDISHSILQNKNNSYKPSYKAPIVETGYEYITLDTKNALPDLEDVKANPKKYEDKKDDKVQVDEKSLLASLSNVIFKPFYEEEPEEETVQYSDEEPISPEQNIYVAPVFKKEDSAKELLRLIEAQQAERNSKKQNTEEIEQFKQELEQASNIEELKITEPMTKEEPTEKEVLVKREEFAAKEEPAKNEIIVKREEPAVKEELVKKEVTKSISNNMIQISSSTYCELKKMEDGYAVFGYIGDKTFELKKYESLPSTKMQIRVHLKQEDSTQYLVKISIHKFIINVKKDEMEFVMDLC